MYDKIIVKQLNSNNITMSRKSKNYTSTVFHSMIYQTADNYNIVFQLF